MQNKIHRRYFWILALAVIFFAGCAGKKTNATGDSRSFPSTLNEAVQEEFENIKAFKRGQYVITGHVVVDDAKQSPQSVLSQMYILPNGDFASAVLDLSGSIAFRLHGYAPFDLQMKNFKPSDSSPLIAVGDIHMVRLKKRDQVVVHGNVKLEGRRDASAAVVGFSISNRPLDSLHNGTAMRPKWPDPVRATVSPSGKFHLAGFSPAEYSVVFKADGYVEQWSVVDFSKPGASHLPPVRLERPKTIALSYFISPTADFSNAKVQTQNILGGTEWKADPNAKQGWDLKFEQVKGQIQFLMGYGPSQVADLGAGDLEKFSSEIDLKKAKFVDAFGLRMISGHIYLLDQSQSFGHWVLFKGALL